MQNKKNTILIVLLLFFIITTILLVFHSNKIKENFKKSMIYSAINMLDNATQGILELEDTWDNKTNIERVVKIEKVKNEFDKVLFIFKKTNMYFPYLRKVNEEILALENIVIKDNTEFLKKSDLKYIAHVFAKLSIMILEDTIFNLSTDEINKIFIELDHNEHNKVLQ